MSFRRHSKLVSFIFLVGLTLLFYAASAHARDVQSDTSYVKNGVFYLPNGNEVKHFGVNYSPSFAFSYRAIERLGIDHKRAIDIDLNHIARLKLNAYRVHVWEKEISDRQGNIVSNIHLDLLDYIIAECAKKNIKVILTAVSWWGNGYPEPDQPSDAFTQGYTKNEMNEDRDAIKATKRYLKQFVNHVNKYSGLSYKDDANIIAFELFNEPRHAGKTGKAKAYINELVKAVRSEGVKQPLFYNISEQGLNKSFAQEVCTSNIDGIAYQWYPTGLVKNAGLKTNTMLSVASYFDPFAKDLGCEDRAKMIYEFDAADSNLNTMYPAMARSFRAAGFQWATQFAYDPAVIAHTNAEYHTHYMNLLYTPKKAIGLLIAAEVFRQLPRPSNGDTASQKDYPANNRFQGVELIPEKNLSILNQSEAFYYSGINEAQPVDVKSLKHIAGVESSELIKYSGSGAYFVDKLDNEAWLLEVYPDVLPLQDPYQQPNLQSEVRRLYSSAQSMTINLPSLNAGFHILNLNDSDLNNVTQANKNTIEIKPGKYLLSNNLDNLNSSRQAVDSTFLLPPLEPTELAVAHISQRQRNLGDKIEFIVTVAGQASGSEVFLAIRYVGDRDFTQIPMKAIHGNGYSVRLPQTDDWNRVGILEYSFRIADASNNVSFPGKMDFWETALRPSGTPISLFDHDDDRDILVYPNAGRGSWQTVAGEHGIEFALRLKMDSLLKDNPNFVIRTTLAKDNNLADRSLDKYRHIVINIKAVEKPTLLGFDLIDRNGFSFGTELLIEPEWQNIVIPISSLKPKDSVLTQAYPSFMPYKSSNLAEVKLFEPSELAYIQGFQIRFPSEGLRMAQRKNWQGIDLANVYLVE